MNRRSFLGGVSRSGEVGSGAVGFEYLPGIFADDERWTNAHRTRPKGEISPTPSGQPLATTAGLEPYVPTNESPWDRRRAYHLLRRTGYAADPAAINVALSGNPKAAVDAIVDAALAARFPATPDWINHPPPPDNAPPDEVQVFHDLNDLWLYETETEFYQESLAILQAGTGLRERLTLFWHDHFVTSLESTRTAAWLYRYWAILRKNALGDFKQFVHEIGITPAMLFYLNGDDNRVGEPNENYARELMELFTMGIEGPDGAPNYTQMEIEELARVLTGWSVDLYDTLEAVFVPEWHDNENKTVFGQAGNWGYDDLTTLLFTQRSESIAHFIAAKLYRFFVYEIASSEIVDELATLLLASDFRIEPVVRTLLQSAHFFDDVVIGARIKSPCDLVLGLAVEAGFDVNPAVFIEFRQGTRLLGQRLYSPPNVAGWPGYHNWVDESSLPARWLHADDFLPKQRTLQELALAMPNPYAIDVLVADFVRHFLPVQLSQRAINSLVALVLNGLPPYEWNPNDQGAEGRLFSLVRHLVQLPEYQLT